MRAWCWSLATGRTQSSEQAPIFMGLWWDGKWSVNLLLVFLGSQHQLDLWLSFPSPSHQGNQDPRERSHTFNAATFLGSVGFPEQLFWGD